MKPQTNLEQELARQLCDAQIVISLLIQYGPKIPRAAWDKSRERPKFCPYATDHTSDPEFVTIRCDIATRPEAW